jgi:hypothetical protein
MKHTIITSLFITLFSISSLKCNVNADVYMHNPRGSNNRCDRRTNDRANANRLFDSQNNAAGGYVVGCNRPEGANTPDDIDCYQMNYYQGSELQLRWTSQHNCGINNNCQFILQYSCQGDDMLGENVRDGHPQNADGNTCTQTIPDKLDEELVNPEKYGKQEDFGHYQNCKNRLRNKRLFTADQKLKGNSAIYTRQNPNGNRYGFECPEERDYFPYWSHSPWIDIAVLTNDPERCSYYQKESQCFQSKYECVGISQTTRDSKSVKGLPSNEEECDNLGGHWIKFKSFQDLANTPFCNFTCAGAPPSSAVNRLGESISFDKYLGNETSPPKTHQAFTWVLPTFKEDLKNCVLRLRYNISTKETPWEFSSDDNDKLQNNPVMNSSNGVPVRMAVNTAQYSRIFEDRSHTFNIIKRPSNLEGDNIHIHNINVQGKRGNIAQVRNCIEYDFVPNNITITQDDFIHFQWVGSDFNPPGNDGEGRAGTDRSNLVVLDEVRDNLPYQESNKDIFDERTSFLLASLGQDINNPDQCFTWDELTKGNQRNNQQAVKNCALLNRAKPYFNISPMKVKINSKNKSVMMCSRNNNFSNRGQKLIIRVIVSTSLVSNNNEGNATTEPSINLSSNSIAGFIAMGIIFSIICIGSVIYTVINHRRHNNDNDNNKDNNDNNNHIIETINNPTIENTSSGLTKEDRVIIQQNTYSRHFRNFKRNFQSRI